MLCDATLTYSYLWYHKKKREEMTRNMYEDRRWEMRKKNTRRSLVLLELGGKEFVWGPRWAVEIDSC
jgi:hypothetical protein